MPPAPNHDMSSNPPEPQHGRTREDTAIQLDAVIATLAGSETAAISIRAIDDTTGGGFDHASDHVVPSASTIKLLILVAVARALESGTLRLDETLPTSADTRVPGSGVLRWMDPDLGLSVQDHAYLMIAISDNTASNVLIDAVGLPTLAETARSLGLEQTTLARHFYGRSPLPAEPDNLTTAADLTWILRAIATDRAASPDRCAWMREVLSLQQHRDRLPRLLPEPVTYFGKTGSLPGLVHDCGVLEGPGGSIAIAVLTHGFDDPYAAEHFIGRLSLAAVADFNLTRGGT